MPTRPTKFHCDRVRGLNITEIQAGFGRVTQSLPVIMGREQVYPVGASAPSFTISGTISEATFALSAAKAAQLIELVENQEGYPFLYLQFPGYETTMNGFYVVESLALPRDRTGILVYPFQLSVKRIGTLSDSRIALYWSATSETYSGWSSLTATSMIALPNGATNVAHTVAGTRTASNGSNQYVENPTRNVITFNQSATVEDWYKAECAVYDTVAPGETNSASYRQVFAANHIYGGDCVIQNGLMRYRIGSGDGTFYAYESVSANLWKSIGEFHTFFTGGLDDPIVGFEITKLTTEEIRWREIRQTSTAPLTLEFILRRGAMYCRVYLSTFTLGIATNDFIRLSLTDGYTQLFNPATNGASGGGALAFTASGNYACAYNTTQNTVAGFVYTSAPSAQPPDPSAGADIIGSGLTIGTADTKTFFVFAFPQSTAAFNLTTGRSNAAAIAAHTLKSVDVKQILVPKAFYA